MVWYVMVVVNWSIGPQDLQFTKSGYYSPAVQEVLGVADLPSVLHAAVWVGT